MATSGAGKSARNSKRVEAWLISVINPVIDSLRREADLLADGNLSWRYFSKKCEYIRPVRSYIEGNFRPNFEDFLTENPQFKKKFEEHDRALSKIEGAASEFAAALLHDPLFKLRVKEALKDYAVEATHARYDSEPRPPGLASMNPGMPETIAEFLINNVGSLPSYYVPYSFWERYREDFVKRFGPRENAKAGVLPRAVKKLQGISARLAGDVTRHRSNLCSKYDMAPVPIMPQGPVEELITRR